MYKYPDKNDKLTIELIKSISFGKYWEESERNALEIAASELEELGKRSFLDVGCGLGRLFSFFAPVVSDIFAVEPDSERYYEALKSAENITGIPVTVVNGDIGAAPPDRVFGAVLCSHVIQHITRQNAEKLACEISKRTEKDGVVILTTTYTEGEKDIFTIEYFENSERVSVHVDEDTFNGSFDKPGVLPVRMLSQQSVMSLMESHGFSLVRKWLYHYAADMGKCGQLPNDEALNLKGDGKGARDVMYIFKKQI